MYVSITDCGINLNLLTNSLVPKTLAKTMFKNNSKLTAVNLWCEISNKLEINGVADVIVSSTNMNKLSENFMKNSCK